jgi:hypothetical protein
MKNLENLTLATFYKLQKEAGLIGQLIYPFFKEFTGFNGLYLLPEQHQVGMGVFEPRVYATCNHFNGVYMGISNIKNSKKEVAGVLISLIVSEKSGTSLAISHRLKTQREKISDIYIEIPAQVFNLYHESSLNKKRLGQIKTVMCLSGKSIICVDLNKSSIEKQVKKECNLCEDVYRRFGRREIDKILTFVDSLRKVILTPKIIINAMM